MITIVAVAIFSLVLVGISIYAWKVGDETEDGFFLGGRSIGTFATVSIYKRTFYKFNQEIGE